MGRASEVITGAIDHLRSADEQNALSDVEVEQAAARQAPRPCPAGDPRLAGG